MPNAYPKWIDEWARAVHNGFSHMVPCSWGPIDVMALIGFLNGAFLSRLAEAVRRIKEKNVPIEKVAECFPSPSSLHVAIYYLVTEYQWSNPKRKGEMREVIEYLLEILKRLRKRDLFAYESNIGHSEKEIEETLRVTRWAQGSPIVARELGRLYVSLDAFVLALYGDFFPQEGHEVYGPYNASSKFGEDTILIIKDFVKIRPLELWPEAKDFKHDKIKIFQIYRDVKFRCELIGKHSLYEGDIIQNLVAYAVVVDGKIFNAIQDMKALRDEFAQTALKQSSLYDTLSKEELKKKMLEWLCYQFVYLFKLAGMDWRPTEAMLQAVKDKTVGDRFESEVFPSYEEYINSREFEVYWLKDLYK